MKSTDILRRLLASIVWTLLIALSAVPGLLAQQGQAELPSGFEQGRSPLLQYESQPRLGISFVQVDSGLRVTQILQDSPVLRLRTSNPNELIQLEVQDVIESVAGMPVKNQKELRAALASSQGECELQIRDHRTQGIVVATVIPKVEDHPVMLSAAAPTNTKIVHVVLAGLSDDPLLGSSVNRSLIDVESFFKSGIPKEQINLTVLSGPDCNALKICETIQSQPVGFKDTLVVYYFGHGAFDPSLAAGDPYGGHFLDIPSGDLMRRTVWDHLEAMPARLRILISDTCNVESAADAKARLQFEMKTTSRVVKGPTALEWLFMGHSGSWDAMAARQGERAWYSPLEGGWFSKCFVEEARASTEWSKVTNQLPSKVSAFYQQKRDQYLANPLTTSEVALNQLKNQVSMTPILVNRAKKDSQPPVPLNLERVFERQITVGVPVR